MNYAIIKKNNDPRIEVQTNILNHMNYAASKLWNVCNYEKRNYKALGIPYPSWYEQKSRLKDNIWFKSLPSQTAQEICNQIDQAFKSYYKLLKTGGIKSPKPPKFKQEGFQLLICRTELYIIKIHTDPAEYSKELKGTYGRTV